MIRPITVLTFILACGSGMYLYQAKHRVHLLDAQIDLAVHQTEAVRGQSRALHAEWMLLNDPDRLHRLAAHYLVNLQPVAPTQFTDLADLDGRLPPVGPPPGDTTSPVVASAVAPGTTTAQGAAGQSPAADASGRREPAATDQASTDQTGTVQTGTVQTGTVQTGTVQTGTVQTGAGQAGAEPAASDVAAVASRAVEPPRGVASSRAVAGARTTERSSQPMAVRTPATDRATRPAIAQSGPTARTPQPVITQARPVGYAPARSVIAQAPRPAARAAEPWQVRAEPVATRTPPRMPAWRPAPPRAVMAAAAPSRFVASAQRPMPPMRPQSTPQSAAYGGSMLGMAHAGASLPRPMPLNAAYNSSNSGG